MSTPLTSQQLAERYPDPDFVTAIRELLNLRAILGGCLISSTYRVPAAMHTPIKLTPYGDRLFEQLTRQRVPYPEARMLCFLEFMHVDLLVDPVETDTDALRAAISEQVKSGDLRFPFIHGRLLYDRVADLALSSDRTYLSDAQTDEVLEGTPQGVFQVGRDVTGPYGLLQSKSMRFIEPIRKAPYHCSEASCTVVHYYALRTSLDAPVNEHREKVSKILQRESQEGSEWTSFLVSTNKSGYRYVYDDLVGDPLIFFIGDALSLNEQHAVVSWLLDKTQGYLRGVAQGLGLRGRADAMAASLTAAEAMQLILCCSNESIISALDGLAHADIIKIPEGEVRRPVINDYVVGPYQLSAEMNRFGLRLNSRNMNLAPLRFRRLVGQMYPFDDMASRIELDWQLREETAESLEAKIEEFLQKRRPREAVSRLLLPRHANLIIATEKLGIDPDLLSTDQDRVNSVMWKLGFATNDILDLHGQFWRYHEAMANACKLASLSPSLSDVEQIRERSNNYFVTLEAILRDSLLYTTWALSTDHYANPRKFVYRPYIDEAAASEILRSFASRDTSEHAVRLEEPLTLFPLVNGFRILAEFLEDCLGRKTELTRPKDEIPPWADSQEIQRFPFLHVIPFLDLLPESQESILNTLRELSRTLVSADVADVRNELSHPRRPDIGRVLHALEAVQETVKALQSSGFLRQAFRAVRTEIDEAARATTILIDPYGTEAVVYDPSYFDWIELPPVGNGVHFMKCAVFHEPNVVLRFTTELQSPYSELWANYPRRHSKPDVVGGSYFSNSSTSLGGTPSDGLR